MIKTLCILVVAAIVSAPIAGAQPVEDSPGWDCRIHGNQICGPTNSQGVPAGNYAGIYEPDTGEYIGGYN